MEHGSENVRPLGQNHHSQRNPRPNRRPGRRHDLGHEPTAADYAAGHLDRRDKCRDGLDPRQALGNGRDAGDGHNPVRIDSLDPGRGGADRIGSVFVEPWFRRNGRLVRHGNLALRKLFRRDVHAAGRTVAETIAGICDYLVFMPGRRAMAGLFCGNSRTAAFTPSRQIDDVKPEAIGQKEVGSLWA
jgi:hypothetical protein